MLICRLVILIVDNCGSLLFKVVLDTRESMFHKTLHCAGDLAGGCRDRMRELFKSEALYNMGCDLLF